MSLYSSRAICRGAVLASTLVGLCACGDGGGSSAPTYVVNATVSGLLTGTSVVLQDNGGDTLPVTANGTIGFHTPIAAGGAYAVTVLTQPTGQTCTVAGGSGTIASANVNIAVTCKPLSYTIGGSVSGLLAGRSVVLGGSTGGAPVTVSGNAPYTFAPAIASGSTYSVGVLTQPVGENCTVANGKGTVAGAKITNVTVTCAALPYTISANVVGLLPNSALVLADNGGNNLTVAQGGTFAFSATVVSGSPYAVTIAAQPAGQTCAVANGSGTVAGSAVTVTITCPWHVLYVANYGDSENGASADVSAMVIDPTSGVLAPVPGGGTAAGPSPMYLTADPSGKHLYVTSADNNNGGAPLEDIYAFAIDPASSALSPIGSAPLVISNIAAAYLGPILLNPSGTFAYTRDETGSILALNATTGAVSLSSSGNGLAVPTSVGTLDGGCAILTGGVDAYCTNFPTGPTAPPAGLVQEFSLNPGTGAATLVAGFAAGEDPQGIVLTPNGQFAYTAQPQEVGYSQIPNGIFAYTVNAASGALSAVTGSPFVAPQAPFSIVVSPNGQAIYLVVTGAVIGYSINQTTGALTQVPGVIATGPGTANCLVIDPSGKFIYALEFSDGSNLANIYAAAVDPTTGGLTPVAGSPFASGNLTAISLAIAAVLP